MVSRGETSTFLTAVDAIEEARRLCNAEADKGMGTRSVRTR